MYRYQEGIGVDLGQLALALQALFIIGAIVSELGGAALPVLSRSVDRGDGKGDHYVDLVLRGGLLMSGVLTITAMAIGPWLVDLLLGPSYALTAVLLPWTLILIAPYFWINTLSSMIVAHGRYWMVMINNALGALIFTLVFPLLVSEFNLPGVVFALTLGLVASVFGQLVTLHRDRAVSFVRVITRTVSAAAGALLVTYLALPLNQWVALMLGLVVLVGFSFMFGVFRVDEVRMAAAFVRSMMKKNNS
jgi:O-antigen/teichoic acid export membrane protein